VLKFKENKNLMVSLGAIDTQIKMTNNLKVQAKPTLQPLSFSHPRHRFIPNARSNSDAPTGPSSSSSTPILHPPPQQQEQWLQKALKLPPYSRGCHVITSGLLQLLPELSEFEMGMANFFIQHTSAGLTINENASPDVPLDLSDTLDKIIPEGQHYRHLDEGLDDMPAHVKSSLMGPSLTIPIQHGRLALGTWQGIYLTEFRNYGGPRTILVTVQGQKRKDGRKYGSHG
jgi:secondary thiamine-phosphate synthase enzyme